MFTLTITQIGAPDTRTTATYASYPAAFFALADKARGFGGVRTRGTGPTYSGTIGGLNGKVFQATHVWDIRREETP
jgi:hypothetical protein